MNEPESSEGENSSQVNSEEDVSEGGKSEESEDDEPKLGEGVGPDKFPGWTADQILAYLKKNPPASDETFPEVKNKVPFSGHSYGMGIWKYEEIRDSGKYKPHDNYVNAVFEYNYERGVRHFFMNLPPDEDDKFEISFDHRSQRPVKSPSNRQLLQRI